MSSLDLLDPGAVPAQQAFRKIRFEIGDGVARLTLVNQAANTLSLELLQEVGRALDAIEFEPSVKLLVVRGNAKYFSAGFEVGDHLGERAYPVLEAFRRVVLGLGRLDKPSMAVVSGAAVGAGAVLASACDVVFCGASARFSFPEIRAGLFNPVATTLLPTIVGRRRTTELLLTGGSLTPAQAEAIGLVTRMLPDERLDEEARSFEGRLAELSSSAIQLTTRALRVFPRFEETLDAAEDIYLNQLLNTEDAAEGVEAIQARRAPSWKGR